MGVGGWGGGRGLRVVSLPNKKGDLITVCCLTVNFNRL